MANYCYYHIKAYGGKKAVRMLYNMMPALDEKYIVSEQESGGTHCIEFKGNCKWSINFGCEEQTDIRLDVSALSEEDIADEQFGTDYWHLTMRQKSELLNIEIQAHYWSDESGFDQFDRYRSGECIARRKIAYDGTEFNWDTLEFEGREGEYDESIDGEERDVDFMNRLTHIINLAAHGGAAAPAEDSGLCRWTFKKGSTVRGDGWTVSVPDGFKRIDSTEDRIFELIPESCSDSDSATLAILPGTKQGSLLGNADLWKYHPAAQNGIVSAISLYLLQNGIAPGIPMIYTTAWEDHCASIMVVQTGFDSYSFQCVVYSDTVSQLLRIQTQSITEKQKAELLDSVIAWLKTFRFDQRNKLIPKLWIEDPACYESLKNGKTSLFKSAVKQANDEYAASVNGRINALVFMENNGILTNDFCKDHGAKILQEAFELQEFYLSRIDAVLQKLEKEFSGECALSEAERKATLSRAYNLLSEKFESDRSILDCVPFYNINNHRKTEAAVPDSLSCIIDRLKKASEEKCRTEEEIRNDLKAANDRAIEKYLAWREECNAVKAQRTAAQPELIEEIKAEMIKAAQQTKHDAVKAAENILAAERSRLQKEESALSSLGFFAISEKKQLKAVIKEIKEKIRSAETAIAQAESTCSTEISQIDNKLKADTSKLEALFDKRYPLPAEPPRPLPGTLPEEIAAARAKEEAIRNALLDALRNHKHLVSEITEFVNAKGINISNGLVSMHLRKLTEKGIVRRKDEKRKSYYYLN